MGVNSFHLEQTRANSFFFTTDSFQKQGEQILSFLEQTSFQKGTEITLIELSPLKVHVYLFPSTLTFYQMKKEILLQYLKSDIKCTSL